MTRRRITHDEAQRVLAGQSLPGRPDLDALARAVEEMRIVAHAPAPQPTAALRERLAAPQAVGVSAEDTSPGGIKRMLTALAGWGIAAKLATGTGALALGVVGVSAAGAAGALPGLLQESFDSVVSTVETVEEFVDEAPLEEEAPLEDEAPEDGTTEEPAEDLPVGSDEFGSWVSENAQDPDKVGAEFGQKVSEQARELRDENRSAREGAGDAEDGDDESSGDDDVQQSSGPGGPGNGKGGRP